MTRTQKRKVILASHLLIFVTPTQGRQFYPWDRGIIKQHLTRTYDPDSPTATCYDALYQSDENGDGILQKYEYINFIAYFSEGDFDAENYVYLPVGLKVNFVHLSCRCKFHPKSKENGGDDCCQGPQKGIYISGTGPQEVPTPEEEVYLQMACADTHGAIAFEMDEMT